MIFLKIKMPCTELTLYNLIMNTLHRDNLWMDSKANVSSRISIVT